MPSIEEVLVRLGGWGTFAELVRLTSRRSLASAVRRGDVVRLRRGIYGHLALASDLAVAIAHDGVLSHPSAAVAWGLPFLVSPEKPHITLPLGRNARPGPPAVLHWGDLPTDDVVKRRTSDRGRLAGA